MRNAPKSLIEISFQDDFVSHLPSDPIFHSGSRSVRDACYSLVRPTSVSNPRLLAWSSPLSCALGLSDPTPENTNGIARVLSGNEILSGMNPYAARYGGHQFGHWAGQLGDGRAITLGEFSDTTNHVWELQLKGAGRTPYSRNADGRAVLRSSLREFLCSEAMHHLGVPTTRALSIVLTGDQVLRDMFYDGNAAEEPGAITSRLAPSFLRFGNFQILEDCGEFDLLKKLADYSIARHFSDMSSSSPEVYALWFEEICRRTAKLIVEWQRVGFVHGVMNTDNMSILGLTIDYGPYGWLEGYDPMWTPNTTDAYGRRYCFGRQPQIGYWNLQRFGESLMTLFGEDKSRASFEKGLSTYESVFSTEYRQMMANKLGLSRLVDRADFDLALDFLDLLALTETDMTIAFRKLSEIDLDQNVNGFDWSTLSAMNAAFYDLGGLSVANKHQWVEWFKRYAQRVKGDSLSPSERKSMMHLANPNFVLRNFLVQEAIDEITTEGSTIKLDKLTALLQRPYDDLLDYPDFLTKRPEWARHRPGCSALSCSS